MFTVAPWLRPHQLSRSNHYSLKNSYISPSEIRCATLYTPTQVRKFGDKPALVSLYSKAASLALTPAFKTTGEVSYETSLGQACKSGSL